MKRKSRGYWTKEKCQSESLKYDSRSNFLKYSKSAYNKSYYNGWLDEICSHMIKNRRDIYWTKDKCQIEALKYKTRTEFINNCAGAHFRALEEGWLDEICSHMPPIGNLHRRCIYSCEFSDHHVYVGLTSDFDKRKNDHLTQDKSSVYKHIKKTNLIPTIKQLTDYIDVEKAKELEKEGVEKYVSEGYNILNRRKTGGVGAILIWTKERCKEESLKYQTRNEFKKKSRGAYGSAMKNMWIDEICEHMIQVYKPKDYWTREKCIEEIMKFTSKGEYYQYSESQFAVRKNKWFDLIENLETKRKKNRYWNKERCQEEALKYGSKKEFKINNGSAYNSSVRNKWINEICLHMLKK